MVTISFDLQDCMYGQNHWAVRRNSCKTQVVFVYLKLLCLYMPFSTHRRTLEGAKPLFTADKSRKQDNPAHCVDFDAKRTVETINNGLKYSMFTTGP